MCGGDAVDGEACAGLVGEVEETGDVIVLVEAGEEALDFVAREGEGGKRNGDAESTGQSAVSVH